MVEFFFTSLNNTVPNLTASRVYRDSRHLYVPALNISTVVTSHLQLHL